MVRDGVLNPCGNVGTAVLGAGPAGLTGAYVLARRGAPGVVFEAGDAVGGISRTVEHDGYRFDLGGHRFFTKAAPIARLWEEVLGDEFLTRPRLSRIYYEGEFFSYPLRAREVPARLGIANALLCLASYAATRFGRRAEPETFEEWVTTRFGKRLYDTFFRSYTEKVWGIPGSEIQAAWAAQRIRDFSLGRALLSMMGVRRGDLRTLIQEFRYPRLGPGQMWEAFRDVAEAHDVPVLLGHRSRTLRHDGRRVTSIVVDADGSSKEYQVDSVLSSIALPDLVLSLDPAPPEAVAEAARRLRYRDLCLVALMTDEPAPFDDNWVYIHDPGVLAGRVQNFGAWSEDMVRPGTTCLGVEYFCFQDDPIWRMSEDEAAELATRELAQIGLLDPGSVIGSHRVRVPRAYPVYDRGYDTAVATIREYLDRFENLEPCGRNGLHRYNNQDHSMLTAVGGMLNLLDGASHDVWSLSPNQTYLEDAAPGGHDDPASRLWHEFLDPPGRVPAPLPWRASGGADEPALVGA